MHIEFLVEEPSAEAALLNLAPKILGADVTFNIHAHQGKTDLLRKLPRRLKGYRTWVTEEYRIVVLIDEDRADCGRQKGELERAAADAGLVTRSAADPSGRFQVLNRIAVEELEAWFFGDPTAISRAYPGASPNLGANARFRNPDAIAGGTWEALEQVLQHAGAHRGGLAKIAAARDISRCMDVEKNQSHSFQVFRDGLRAAVR